MFSSFQQSFGVESRIHRVVFVRCVLHASLPRAWQTYHIHLLTINSDLYFPAVFISKIPI